jgi:hypothetical protein
VDAMRPQITAQSMYPSAPGMPSAPMQTMARGGGGYNLSSAYPSLRDFMGLELSEEMIRLNMPEYVDQPAVGGYPTLGSGGIMAVPQGSSSMHAWFRNS